MKISYRLLTLIKNLLVYIVLTLFAFIMLFPFLYMVFTSFKLPKDTFRYPPKLLPREQVTIQMEGYSDPVAEYYVKYNGARARFALVEQGIKMGVYAEPTNLEVTYLLPLSEEKPTGQKVTVDGEEKDLFTITANGKSLSVVKKSQTAAGRFVNPADPTQQVYQVVRTSEPVEKVVFHPENYKGVFDLQGLDRSLTNTALVTFLVVIGQLFTSVLGGYAFARLKFPGRDQIFLLYLGTIMIPFVVLIIPLYQLMVWIGWQDRLTALIIPWIFSAYGTFMMRQFFLSIPKEIEEAALIDGASRWQILTKIFIPASTPALATQATFAFLYAWNSFVWPLIIINTGNTANHVLTLSLNMLRGRASDSPNYILAGAAIAILPPLIVFLLAQRYYIESVTSSGVKG